MLRATNSVPLTAPIFGGQQSNQDFGKVLTKVFYLQQVDFGGYLLPTQQQVQLLSNFMTEYIDQACERSINMIPS